RSPPPMAPLHHRVRLRSKGPGRELERLDTRELLSLSAPLLAASPMFRRPVNFADLDTRTPHERARERFSAVFSGQYQLGAGRTTDQAFQIYLSGGGSSNAFLHGDVQLALFRPTDPTAQITGTATLLDKNVGSSGNYLLIDITADPSSVDRRG